MTRFLSTAIAAAFVVAAASSAHASDIGLAGPAYDWSGGYVGVNAGAAFDNTSVDMSYQYKGFQALSADQQSVIDSLGSDSTNDQIVFTGGILAGYNWEYANIVFGLEGDFNYLGFNRSESRDVTNAVNLLYGFSRGKEDIASESDWYGTVRGRLGYAFDNFMVYGTGGLAYGEANFKSRLTASIPAGSATWSGRTGGWNFGWTAGGGVEYGIDNWVLGAEYLYVDLGSYSWNTQTLGEIEGKGRADPAFSVARATLKYRF